jgi:hypothetical protein
MSLAVPPGGGPWSRIPPFAPRLRRFNAETQRFAEPRRESFSSAFLRAPPRLCVKPALALVAAWPGCALALISAVPPPAWRFKKNQAGLEDRPDL